MRGIHMGEMPKLGWCKSNSHKCLILQRNVGQKDDVCSRNIHREGLVLPEEIMPYIVAVSKVSVDVGTQTYSHREEANCPFQQT
jgi:hypothetical protein